jgi:tryptophan synthase alpha chain
VTTPLERLDDAFRAGRTQKRALLMPYLVTAFPDAETFVSVARAAGESGAGVLELGIPFSDPIMDGPVIQRASNRVLQRGLPVDEALKLIERATEAAGVPSVVMTYYNVVFRRGVERFARELADAGVSGAIVPDLVVEESEPWCAACKAAGIGPVMIAAPTSPPARLRALADCTKGFVYAASTLGVTGLRESLSNRAHALVSELRAVTTKPIAVGIGVSNASQVREVAEYADGVIVGTAVVKAIEESNDPPGSVLALLRELSEATARA